MTAWRLDGADTTLLLLGRGEQLPEIVHWGARLPALTAEDVCAMRDRAVAPNALDDDVPFASVLPTLGAGTFGGPALAAVRGRVDWTAEFRLDQVEERPQALVLHASDPVSFLTLEIRLSLAQDGDTLMQSVALTPGKHLPVSVHHLAAGVFVLPPRARTLLTLGARWGREFAEHRVDLPAGMLAVENRRGRTSHDRQPSLIVGTDGPTEDAGEAWGVHLGWSGNHRTTAERLPDGSLLVQSAQLLHPGEAEAGEGACFSTPDAVCAYSEGGLAGVSRALHRHVRTQVLRWPGGRMAPRPVTLNTWEGTYFAHDERRLMAQAEAAAALGIERFVLDDGWMLGRRDDMAGLGDWAPDPRKYPGGLLPLARHVVSLGMQFGLWVEPEMATPGSEFLRAHPDAVLHMDGRTLRTARHQLVLDLARESVRAAILRSLERLLSDLPIRYLKWDMNRDLVAAGDSAGHPAYDGQVRALYAMLSHLRRAFPELEIESCASGGGRADYGVLRHAHRVWASDCTDALDRLAIQRGALRFFPPEVIGAHVSGSPNHQTGRRHALGFRAAVALFFHMGVELDPLALPAEERDELAGWIALHKRLRHLLHAGEHVALPIEDSRSLLGVVTPDRSEAAYLVAQEASPLRAIPAPLRLPGLDAAVRYRIHAPAPQRVPARVSATHRALFAAGVTLPGAALATGFVPPPMLPETALVLHVTRIEGG